MSGTGEDNGNVGQTLAHPHADRVKNPIRGAAPSVGGRMLLAVMCGAFVGLLVSVIVAPSLVLAFVVGGAMSFGAVAVALFMFKSDTPDEYASGFARSDSEVRDTLADIEARKK